MKDLSDYLYYHEDGPPVIDIYCGDCLEIMPLLPKVDLVVTDPPYGIGVNTDWVNRKDGEWAKESRPIIGDDKPFDPTPLFRFKNIITWGANHYADKLPPSADWLVWDKRRGASITKGWNAPDCELAWTNLGCGCRYFSHLWEGYKRQSEIGQHYHPTQKPIQLMKWAIQQCK